MTCLFDAEHALDPCYDFMAGRVGWFVEVDDAGGYVGFEIAFERGTSMWDWCEMACSDED